MKIVAILVGIFAFIILALGGTYVGSSWFIGKKIAESYPSAVKGIQQSLSGSSVSFSVTDFKKGLFKSDITSKFSVTPKAGQLGLVSLVCRSELKHGPFLGLGFGLVATESRCHVDAPGEANSSLKNIDIITEKSTVGFDQSVKGVFKLEAFSQPIKERSGDQLDWKGCESKYSYNHSSHEIKSNGTCGGLSMLSGPTTFTLGSVSIQGSSTLLIGSDGTWQISKGNAVISLSDGISFKRDEKIVSVKGVSINSSTDTENDLSHGTLRLSADSILVDQNSLGSMEYSIGYENIYLSALRKLQNVGGVFLQNK